MGTSFFKPKAAQRIGGSNLNMEARALGASTFAGRAAGGAAAKDVGAAAAIGRNAGPLAKTQRSDAYAPGPKKV